MNNKQFPNRPSILTFFIIISLIFSASILNPIARGEIVSSVINIENIGNNEEKEDLEQIIKELMEREEADVFVKEIKSLKSQSSGELFGSMIPKGTIGANESTISQRNNKEVYISFQYSLNEILSQSLDHKILESESYVQFYGKLQQRMSEIIIDLIKSCYEIQIAKKAIVLLNQLKSHFDRYVHDVGDSEARYMRRASDINAAKARLAQIKLQIIKYEQMHHNAVENFKLIMKRPPRGVIIFKSNVINKNISIEEAYRLAKSNNPSIAEAKYTFAKEKYNIRKDKIRSMGFNASASTRYIKRDNNRSGFENQIGISYEILNKFVPYAISAENKSIAAKTRYTFQIQRVQNAISKSLSDYLFAFQSYQATIKNVEASFAVFKQEHAILESGGKLEPFIKAIDEYLRAQFENFEAYKESQMKLMQLEMQIMGIPQLEVLKNRIYKTKSKRKVVVQKIEDSRVLKMMQKKSSIYKKISVKRSNAAKQKDNSKQNLEINKKKQKNVHRKKKDESVTHKSSPNDINNRDNKKDLTNHDKKLKYNSKDVKIEKQSDVRKKSQSKRDSADEKNLNIKKNANTKGIAKDKKIEHANQSKSMDKKGSNVKNS